MHPFFARDGLLSHPVALGVFIRPVLWLAIWIATMPSVGWFAALLFVIALVDGVSRALLRSNTQYTITTRRLVMSTGIVRKRSLEMARSKVESIAVNEPWFGRMVGYGTVVGGGTGGTKEAFHMVPDPPGFERVPRSLWPPVIRTMTIEPAPGANTPASASRQDGWYVDLPSCWERGGQPDPFQYTSVQKPNTPPDRVHVKRLGTAHQGYPVEEMSRSQTDRGATTSTLELIDVSDAPLDAALFTVPPGYGPALPRLFGGYDLTKPDTLTNRVQSYFAELVAWTNRLFH